MSDRIIPSRCARAHMAHAPRQGAGAYHKGSPEQGIAGRRTGPRDDDATATESLITRTQLAVRNCQELMNSLEAEVPARLKIVR